MTWKREQVSFEFVHDGTADQVVTVRIATPMGGNFAMAEVEISGRNLVLNGFHIHSDAGVRQIGVSNLRMLAEHVLEELDYDELIIQGASRTTGAGPGRAPGRLRFTRRCVPSPRSKP